MEGSGKETGSAERASSPGGRTVEARALARGGLAADRLYVVLTAVFVTCLVLGDVTGGKNFATPFGPVSVGMTLFPVTFLLTDVVNDYYGRKGARFVTLVGAGMATLAYVALVVTTALPIAADTYFEQGEYAKIFGGSARLFLASILAYLVGQLLDIYIFQFWKRITGSRHLWLRATGSTVLSQLADTLLINFVFWGGVAGWPADRIGAKALREYLIKVAIAVLLTPALYALHALVTRRLGLVPAPPEPG